MEIELAFEKLLNEKGIQESDLPEDAQVGIKSIREILSAIKLTEKQGRTVRPSAIAKLRANDKWVVREIYDFIDDKDDNKEPLPNPAKKVITEIRDDDSGAKKDAEPNTPQITDAEAKARKIDLEFEELLKQNKSILTLDELKAAAPTAYDVLFEAYNAEEENGIETTHYLLIEGAEKEKFTLTKK